MELQPLSFILELPLLQLTTNPAFFRHGDRVTVRCEFVPLPEFVYFILLLLLRKLASLTNMRMC